jgi:tetratricopeptide (TPR) repeat protein
MPLSADYWSDEVPIVGFGNIKVIFSAIGLVGLAGLAIYLRKKSPVASWGILFFFLTLLPVSNFLFPAGFLKAERILYIPSIGLIITMAFGMLKVFDFTKGKSLEWILLAGFSLFFITITWLRTEDWKNNFTLATATLMTSPNSPRFNNMMGLELRAQKNGPEALRFFEKAVQSNPNHVPALVNLGTEYRNIGRLNEAATTLEKALNLDPNTLATYVNLMSVYRSMEDYDKNVNVAQKAVERFPQSAAVIWNAANAYQLKGDMNRANELRAKAREIDPSIGVEK